MSNTNDWGQIYQQSLSRQSDLSPEDAQSRTMFGALSATTGSASATTDHLSPENRASKPVRKRTRASRRTPTTLLNTDTSNFRAMVQQFTGGPSASFSMESHLNGSPNPHGFTFGFGQRQFDAVPGNIHPQTHLLPPRGSYNVEHHHQLHHPQPSHDQYMFSYGNVSTTHDSMAYLQRLGNPRGSTSEISSGFGDDGRGAHSVSSTTSETRRTNTFMY